MDLIYCEKLALQHLLGVSGERQMKIAIVPHSDLAVNEREDYLRPHMGRVWGRMLFSALERITTD